ncbi:ABC transporter substrate-binding protein [Streptomyces sp. NPDC058319]|uniref:ABC transporter substrate-binding protein n=1 Tax=unclassified Streptomyces TaxID=2593676 RepID=UPI0036E6EF5F
MTRGFWRVTGSLALAFSLVTGCAHADRGPAATAITVWMYPVIADPRASAAYWKQVERAFAEASPGVRLTVAELPWADRDSRLTAALADGTGPDAVLLMPDQLPRFALRGAVAPVGDVLEDTAGKFLPSALAAATVRGEIYGAPIYQTVTTTLYNKRLLDDAGVLAPPATWKEVEAAAPKLRRNGVALLDYSAADDATLNLNFYPLLWQAGGHVFSPDGKKAAFNSAAGVRALTFLATLYGTGAIPPTSTTSTNRLADEALGRQQAAMGYSVDPADADLAARTWGADNVLVGAPLRGPVQESAFGAPGVLSVNAASRHQAETREFLAFMTRPAQIKSLSRASGYLSPRADVVVPNASPYARQYQEALASVSPGEPNPVSRQVMRLLAPEIRATLTGRKSARRALDDAAAAADALLARSS